MGISRTDYDNGTWIERDYPWGSDYRIKVLCSDGKLRSTRRISEADTFFSIPVTIQVKRCSVRGFVSVARVNDEENTLIFTPYEYCKNDHLLPAWKKDYYGLKV